MEQGSFGRGNNQPPLIKTVFATLRNNPPALPPQAEQSGYDVVANQRMTGRIKTVMFWAFVAIVAIGSFRAVEGQIIRGNEAAERAEIAARPQMTQEQFDALYPEPCRATIDEYRQLREGMSIRQAETTIGCHGEELSQATISGSTAVMLAWRGRGRNSAVTAMFQDGVLVTRAQVGL